MNTECSTWSTFTSETHHTFQIKHGEAAYPKDAWVELQYSKIKGENPKILQNMSGISASPDISKKCYNDAFQMVPTFGQLHDNMKKVCLKNVGKKCSLESNGSNISPQNGNGNLNHTFEVEVA